MGREANQSKEMPFTEHLEELRWHILRSLFYLIVLFGVCWYGYDTVYTLVTEPVENAFRLAGHEPNFLFLDFFEPLLFRIQLVLSAGVILGLPLFIWEVWRFVAPGLYAQERRYVAPLLPFSLVLCIAGLALVYFALPIAIRFLLQFAPTDGNVELMQNPQRYYFFLLRMMIGAGVAFQTPIVLLILGQLEIVTSRGLLSFWRHAILICFTVAAIITPTIDPLNMSIIAVPLVGLYFLSVILVWFVERGRRRAAAGESPADDQPTPPSPGDGPSGDPPSGNGDAPPAPDEPPALEGPTLADQPPALPAPVEEPEPEPVSPAPVTAAPPVVDRSALGPKAMPRPEPQPAPPPAAPERPSADDDEALFSPGFGEE